MGYIINLTVYLDGVLTKKSSRLLPAVLPQLKITGHVQFHSTKFLNLVNFMDIKFVDSRLCDRHICKNAVKAKI